MGRRETLAKAGSSIDLSNPAPGMRLQLGTVATRLGCSITVMSEATGISRTAIANLLTNNWPVNTPRHQIAEALMKLMEERGATDEELRTLFHGHGRQNGSLGQREQRGPDERAPELPPHQPTNPTARRPGARPPLNEDHDMLPLKAVLTAQAKRQFRLFRNPFDGPVNTDAQMYLGDEFAYVREAAWQCAQTAGFVAIVGESGAGKTTVLEDLEARLEKNGNNERVILIKPSVVGMEENDTTGKTLKSADVLHAIVSTLQPDVPMPQTMPARTLRARKLLTASASMGNRHLLVIEEAHSMPNATLKHLKRMHELREGRNSLLGILLLAQPELKRRLADGLRDGTLREVAQRCEVVELLPLDGDIKPFLAKRCNAADVDLAKLIDADGVEQIRERLTRRLDRGAVSMCYPLAVCNLMVMALNKAAGLGAPIVTADIVKAA